LASGVAGTFPGIGTAAAIGIQAGLLRRDVLKDREEKTGMTQPERRQQQRYELQRKSREQYEKRDSVETSRPVFTPKTKFNDVSSINQIEQTRNMQLQARLFAVEMQKVYESDRYKNTQTDMSKRQAEHMARVTYG